MIEKSQRASKNMPRFCFFNCLVSHLYWTFISDFRSLFYTPFPVNVVGNFFIAISENG